MLPTKTGNIGEVPHSGEESYLYGKIFRFSAFISFSQNIGKGYWDVEKQIPT